MLGSAEQYRKQPEIKLPGLISSRSLSTTQTKFASTATHSPHVWQFLLRTYDHKWCDLLLLS
jgi:hypothetical protein